MAAAKANEPAVKQYKVKKNLTKPLFKCIEDVPLAIKVQDKMFIGKEMKAVSADGKKKEPATLVNCINLETGEEGQVILHAVVKSVFMDEYPNDTYVGKAFLLTKRAKQLGKAYNKFEVQEIEA